MGIAQDRLKRAFNILARQSIDSVDLYGELAKTEALVNGLSTISMMQKPIMQPPAAQIPPQQMPVEDANNPIL